MSVDDSVVVMDQYADTAAQFGLAHVGLPVSSSGSDSSGPASSELASSGPASSGPVGSEPVGGEPASVVMTARSVMGLLMLRASSDATALSEALQHRCGVSLSERLQSNTHEACCVRWMSPDCWLLSCPLDEAFAIEQSLRADVLGHIAIVNVSGGYSIVELKGRDARSVLMKSTGYDVHPDHFSVGKVVNTTFAKAQVTMRVVELGETDAHYELVVRRSFSDYLWLWLQRAGAEYAMSAVADF